MENFKMEGGCGMGHGMGQCCGGMGMGGGMGHGGRKFYTKSEKREWLAAKIKETELELQGMREKLEEIK
jgi:hypothetical protein